MSADGSRTVGRYVVEREIGRGSMAVVYLAHDPFRNHPVALKVMHTIPRESDPRKAAMFESLFFNETRAAGRLKHPNIVRVFDAGVDGEDYFIAMEYVPGMHTLEDHCTPDRLLSIEAIAGLIFKCAEGLDYAHRKGVVHRDVKPANILLGRDDTVKIADFSVAVLSDPQLVDTQLLLPAGSPMYMSPEQIREEGVTGQSDLFSLGTVLYELLTGRHPFRAGTLAGVTHRVLHETPPPACGLRPDTPDSLQRVLDRALAKDQASRYATAFELAADLGGIFAELHRPQDGIATEGRAEVLKGLAFFESFHDAEIWELLRWAQWQEHPDGSVVIREGDVENAFYIVAQGEVEVRKGGQVIVTLPAGECIGEIGYLSGQPRTASVVAKGGVAVLQMNAGLIERASERCQIQFQRVFIETLIARLVQTTAALARRDG